MPCRFKIKRFGWKPDLPDTRDKYRITRPRVEPLPPVVNLRTHFPPCYDQGDLGSCTANAIAGLLEFDQLKQQQLKTFTPSRLFIYYGERVIEGTIGEDAGAMIRDGIKVVADLGAPPETVWKYNEEAFARKPSKKAFACAKAHQAILYERVRHNLSDIKACLADGYPFAFGFSVYDGFESDTVANTGKLDYPKPDEGMIGGHAVVACGYNEEDQRILVRNSWGDDWGDNGYFTMGYDYLLDRNLCDDLWMIRKIE